MKTPWILGLGLGGALAWWGCTQEATPRVPRLSRRVQAIQGLDAAGNARRIPEGYVLSGMLSDGSVPILEREGVRHILSAVTMPASLQARIQAAGIEIHPIPLGSTFRHAATILAVSSICRPEELLIHCTHGADRTGAVVAFLLAAQHGWKPAAALWAVLAPTRIDVEGLNLALGQVGDNDRRSYGAAGIGIYSPTAIGRSGGMKTRSEDYRRLASTAYSAMINAGARP